VATWPRPVRTRKAPRVHRPPWRALPRHGRSWRARNRAARCGTSARYSELPRTIRKDAIAPDIPIVFAHVTDPVGTGFVTSLARPGGNITGFTQHEFAIGVKWLELLKELAPRVKRVAVLHHADNPASAGYLATITPAAPTFGVELTITGVRNTAEHSGRGWRSSAGCRAKTFGSSLVGRVATPSCPTSVTGCGELAC
jgi:ABC transporter substrate binding protein